MSDTKRDAAADLAVCASAAIQAAAWRWPADALPHWIERATAAEAEVERLRAALAAKGGAV